MIIQKLNIRRATPDDAGVIADIGARTFEASFGPDNRLEDMEQYLSLSFSKAHIKTQLSDPASVFLLAYENEKVVGYLMLRRRKTPKAVSGANPVEPVRFYVEEKDFGNGYGSALMDACPQEAKKDRHRTIWLGVWEKNQRAIRFYKKWGFTIVGSKEFVLGSDLQNDHIMARPVR